MTGSPRGTRHSLGLILSAAIAVAFLGAYAQGAGGAAALPRSSADASHAPATLAPARTAPGEALDLVATAIPPAGTRDTVLIGPPVPRPSGTPCVVELFRDAALPEAGIAWFNGDGVFPYAPPAQCPGPWAKVILKVSFRNDAPASYLDGLMLAQVSLAGVPLYSGGGQDNDVPTHWRVERDVTDYSALLAQPGDGTLEARASPRYPPDFQQPFYASATLLFYPPTPVNRVPRVADEVHPLTSNGWQQVSTPANQVGTTLTLPRNVERAYLDVMAHPAYGNDLFWFTCMPDAAMSAFPELASRLAIGPNRRGLEGDLPSQGCRGGSFRQVLVRIDDEPAGLAAVFPRLYPQVNPDRGPGLAQPAPPPLALNFMPYRVDLSPFAGKLSDGQPHKVALSMVSGGTITAFDLTGTLLVYRDAGTPQITGAVTGNTLAGASLDPIVDTSLARDAATGRVGGTVTTTFAHSHVIEGYVETSRGRIQHRVEQRLAFDNRLMPDALGTGEGEQDDYRLQVRLDSTITGISRRTRGVTVLAEDTETFAYPLVLDYHGASLDLQQAFTRNGAHSRPGVVRYYTRLEHRANVAIDADQQLGDQRYRFRDSHGGCYSADMAAEGGALAAYTQGTDCPDGRNRLFWASHPDGSPEGLGWAER